MSVCFFVPATDQAGTSNAEEVESEGVSEETQTGDSTQQSLEQFWLKATEDIKSVCPDDFKTQVLPLARIKKIMKLDDEVKMISAEAPVLFAKAVEIFIQELTLRAWSHTEDNKRRTLQRNDIAMAISKSDQFDFLIDIVPRHEVKSTRPRFQAVWGPKEQDQPCLQQTAQQHTVQNSTVAPQQQILLQPCTQIVQPGATTSASNNAQPHPVALVQSHQVVNSNGEIQSMPSQIQLTQAQLNMIRLQVQNNPNQPIIIQAQPQQSPQIIQVSSQGQPQPQQQVYIQVASQEETN